MISFHENTQTGCQNVTTLQQPDPHDSSDRHLPVFFYP
ncbi:hypothetical protein AC43_2943 [Escherichia coli 2-156-04_S3_C3]|nr:hypothetical protein AC43_2943 [Escherichia coli 2-156-04_S3_C3]